MRSSRSAVGLKEYVEKMDWSKFKVWLDDRLESHYAHNVYLYSNKYSHLAFAQEFADMPNNRKKLEIMRSVTNL